MNVDSECYEEDEEYGDYETGGLGPVLTLAIIYVIVLLINVIVLAAVKGFSGDGPILPNEVIAKRLFDLESNKPYPLYLGGRIDGASSEVTTLGGFFSASAQTTLPPRSALRVNFHSKSKNYILDLPMESIVFVKKANTPETIKLSIGGNQAGGTYPSKFRGIILPGGDRPVEKTSWYQDFQRNHQLGKFLVRYGALQAATITLTPQDYNKILG